MEKKYNYNIKVKTKKCECLNATTVFKTEYPITIDRYSVITNRSTIFFSCNDCGKSKNAVVTAGWFINEDNV